MKRLYLLRHAKAVAGSTKSEDSVRPLSERGRMDASRVALAMRHKGYIPDRVLCSTSRRTMETWELAAPELNSRPSVGFSDGLYLAPAKSIVQALRAEGDSLNSILVIAHNPGLEECARALARKPRSEDEHRRFESLSDKFPTAALAVLEFEIQTWRNLTAGIGHLVDFIRPRELMGE